MDVLRAGAAHFGIAFGAGFVLGPFRVLLLEPRVGSRAAELIEVPVMLGVIVFAGRWVARRWGARIGAVGLLVAGSLAAAMVLAADLAVGVRLRGMSVAEVLTGRDAVSGTAYYALTAACALAPWLLRGLALPDSARSAR